MKVKHLQCDWGYTYLRSFSCSKYVYNLHGLTNYIPKLCEVPVHTLLLKTSHDRNCNSCTSSDDKLTLLPRGTRHFPFLHSNCWVFYCIFTVSVFILKTRHFPSLHLNWVSYCIKAGNLNRKCIWAKTKWGEDWFWSPERSARYVTPAQRPCWQGAALGYSCSRWNASIASS